MTDLLPCPFPMSYKPVIAKVGNCYEIRCLELKRGIYIGATVRVREDIGDEKLLTEIWNGRAYPKDVQEAIDKRKRVRVIAEKLEKYHPEGSQYKAACPDCHYEWLNIGFNLFPELCFCRNCGKALELVEE